MREGDELREAGDAAINNLAESATPGPLPLATSPARRAASLVPRTSQDQPMDFLNKAFAQLRELFVSMTPGTRITTALLLLVVVISLGYLVIYGVSGPSTYLMDGAAFSPDELLAMEAAFAKAGLKDYARDGGRIRVPAGKHPAYVAALADADVLPANIGEIPEKALRDSNPFQSKEQQQELIKSARQKQLSRIIREMRGVENAWVIYDAQVKGGLKREELKKATVFVKRRGNEHLDRAAAAAIRRLVPFAGLKPKDVVVVCTNSGKAFYEDEEAVSADFDPYIERKRLHEQEYRAKILEALSYVPGVTVSCNVELGDELLHREEKIEHDPKAVAQQVTESTRTRTRDGTAPGGRPGPVAQQNTRMTLDNSSVKGAREEEEESNRQEFNLLSSTRKEITTIGMAVKRVRASVVVPSSYFTKVWNKLNPAEPGQPAKTPSQAELDQIRTREVGNIQACVAGLLPKPADATDPAQLVSVTVFQDIQPEDLPLPSWHERLFSWLAGSWSMLGMLGLALVSLLMLRSMVRSMPATETSAVIKATVLAETAQTEDAPADTTPAKRAKRFQSSGGSLLEDLSDLVSSDPDTAANILRNWIGNVS